MINGKNFSSSTTASSTPYDNTTSGMTARNVKDALDELRTAGGALISIIEVSATAATSTSSSTYSVIPGMTVTPPSGTYLINFSGSGAVTSGVNGSGQIAIHKNGTILSHSTRTVSLTVALVLGLIGTAAVAPAGSDTCGVIQVNGTDTIDIRFRSVTGDPFQFTSRSIQLIKVGL